MYDIEIKIQNQPMLITKAKKKDICKKNAPKVCYKFYIKQIIIIFKLANYTDLM